MRLHRLLPALLACVLLTACSGSDRDVAREVRVADPWGAVSLFDAKGPPRVGGRRGDLNILSLSGGGADGAFGAGVLTAWSGAGRPKFDIVTGVSTGALQATFAFLGPAYDKTLTDLYTCTCSADLFKSRGLGGLLGDSLFDTEPLREKISKVVDDAVVAKVASEHRAGRRLYVATTNLDAGVVTVWDMGAIAASDRPGKGELYREILRASAAVPGFFKPVELHPEGEVKAGGQLHVDGGVKAPLLLRGFMVEGAARRKNVYLLVNGAMKLRAEGAAAPAGIGGIAKKSITELLRGLLYKTVYQAYVTSRHAGATFRLGYLPDDVPESVDPLEFDQAEMKKLYAAGQALMRRGALWRDEPPRLEPLERVGGGPRR